MGTSVANWRGFRHRSNINGVLQAQDDTPSYHLGTAQIDTQRASAIDRTAILALHDAAVTSQAAFDAAAGQYLGSWWSSLCAAATAAGVTGSDRPEVVARTYYRAAVDLS